jgi:hypothetical protein
VLKLVSKGAQPMQYFLGKKSGAYNRFDFTIVALRWVCALVRGAAALHIHRRAVATASELDRDRDDGAARASGSPPFHIHRRAAVAAGRRPAAISSRDAARQDREGVVCGV